MDQAVPSEEYTRYVICKEMGWDFHTYESQPPSFIEAILIFMNQEALRSKRDTNKNKGRK